MGGGELFALFECRDIVFLADAEFAECAALMIAT
jgi:hypothetical protein